MRIVLRVVAVLAGAAVMHAQSVQPPRDRPTTGRCTSRPAPTSLTADELAAIYRAQVDGIQSLVISGEFIARNKTQAGPYVEHEISGTLFAQRPNLIRIIGRPPLLGRRVFDIASDGHEVHLQVPNPMRFFIEPVELPPQIDPPLTSIRPQHILQALLWPEVPSTSTVRTDPGSTHRVLKVSDADSEQSIYYDDAVQVERIDSSIAGNLAATVRYAEWTPASDGAQGQICLPRHIWIERPRERYELELLLNRMTVNQALPLSSFDLEPPPGIQIIHVGASATAGDASAGIHKPEPGLR